MTILRPITEKLPATTSISKETNLPFSFVLTPYAHVSSVSKGNDDAFYQKQELRRSRRTRQKTNKEQSDRPTLTVAQQSHPFQSPTRRLRPREKEEEANNHEYNSYENNDDEKAQVVRDLNRQYGESKPHTSPKLPLKVSLIAKCTNCGSPMNSHTATFISDWRVLCHLCGSVYSIEYQEQYQSRMEVDTSFRYYPKQESSSNTNITATSQQETQHEYEYRTRYGGYRRFDSSLEELGTDTVKEYTLPAFVLSNPSTSSSQTKKSIVPCSALPTEACPPLLLLIIDGTTRNPLYYHQLSQALDEVLLQDKTDIDQNFNYSATTATNTHTNDSLKKHTHVAFFIMQEYGGLSVFDLQSPTGHIKHVWVGNSNHDDEYQHDDDESSLRQIIPLSQVLSFDQIFVSLSSPSAKSRIGNVLRIVADSTFFTEQTCRRRFGNDVDDEDDERDLTSTGPVFGRTLKYILEFMEDIDAYHPGMMTQESVNDVLVNEETIMYAGGKVMCFLSGPIAEVGKLHEDIYSNGCVGFGGFAGTCSKVGDRHGQFLEPELISDNNDVETGSDGISSQRKTQKGSNDRKDRTTQENNHDVMPPKAAFKNQKRNVEEYFQNLGTDFANAAMGVELFALVEDGKNTSERFVGLPILRLLSDRSGGSGPILASLSEDNSHMGYQILIKEICARSPWYRQTAFGTQLSVRLSSTLAINKHSDKPTILKGVYFSQPSDFYMNDGVYGPVSADDNIYISGSFDSTSTICFDVHITSSSGELEDHVSIDGRGDYRLMPSIQSCFAYTSVVLNNGKYYTVRRLRVLSERFDVADNTEELTESLDVEPLSVILFHKFYHNSLRNGISQSHSMAKDWLLSTLISTYHSAQQYYRNSKQYRHHTTLSSFFPPDRILDVGGSGSLTDREVLLAKGHERLHHLTLLIFCLMHCDALRHWSSDQRPSMDSRCAAAANMGCMTAESITRLIAPRLQLWLSENNEKVDGAVMDNISLSLDAVCYAVKEQTGSLVDEAGQDSTGMVQALLFLDSPRNVLAHSSCKEFAGLPSSEENTHLPKVPIGLRKDIQEAVRSYRVAPFLTIVAHDGNTSVPYGNAVLTDTMIEDIPSSDSIRSYTDWCNDIAEIVNGNIDST